MIGKTNAGGAGGGLNLKVVGGTSSPGGSVKDNTIWVNTATPINGYAFSADEPENPSEGMVWVKTATESTTPINVDKKNTVILYPQTAQQYVGGVWVGKTAKTFQGGAWKSWHTFLIGSRGIVSGYETAGQTDQVTVGAASVDLSYSGSFGRWSVFYYSSYNLSNYSRMTAKGRISETSNWFRLGVAADNTTVVEHQTFLASVDVTKTGEFEVELDISSFSGNYCIALYSSISKVNVTEWALY